MLLQAQDAHLCSAVLALVHLLLESNLTAIPIFQALTKGSKQSVCLTEAGMPLICLPVHLSATYWACLLPSSLWCRYSHSCIKNGLLLKR